MTSTSTSKRSALAAAIEARHGSLRGWMRALTARVGHRFGALGPFVRVSPARVERLVFVCLGNLNRSAFAAAVALQQGVPPAAVLSIGLAAPVGARPPETTLLVSSEFGIDLSAHRAAAFSDYEYRPGDLLLVMETRHARALLERGAVPESIALLGHWATPPQWHIEDPQGLSAAYCRNCLQLLRNATVGLIRALNAGGSPAVRRR